MSPIKPFLCFCKSLSACRLISGTSDTVLHYPSTYCPSARHCFLTIIQPCFICILSAYKKRPYNNLTSKKDASLDRLYCANSGCLADEKKYDFCFYCFFGAFRDPKNDH